MDEKRRKERNCLESQGIQKREENCPEPSRAGRTNRVPDKRTVSKGMGKKMSVFEKQ